MSGNEQQTPDLMSGKQKNIWLQRRRRISEIIEVGASDDIPSRCYDFSGTLILLINVAVTVLYTFDEMELHYGSILLPRGVIVAMIRRCRENIVPRGNVVLKVNDTIILGAEALRDDKHIDLKEIVLLKHSPWNGVQIRDLDISRQTIIVMVKRNDMMLVPNGDLVLLEGDHVILYSQERISHAGIIKRIPMCDMSVEDFTQVIDVDLIAPFICAKAVIPGMIEKGHGKIINICSMMSELGRETVSAYAAAKGGLKMLTRNICSEYGGANIQCNGIGPGYIATSQTAPLRERQADGSRHPFDSFIISKTPAGRWGTTDDLIGPTVFLASDASNFVNGHILYVDGGILAYIGKQP